MLKLAHMPLPGCFPPLASVSASSTPGYLVRPLPGSGSSSSSFLRSLAASDLCRFSLLDSHLGLRRQEGQPSMQSHDVSS